MFPILDVEELVFEYPGTRALDRVSFRLERGVVVALVGPNGSGKTTLLRCLAVLDRPASGQVRLDGIDVQEQPRDSHRWMGFLGDRFGVYEELTVEECLGYRAAAQGIPPSRRAEMMQRAADRLGISDRASTIAGTLSRGWRQRLAIAEAILHEPALLMLDEPTSGLDSEARVELAASLCELAASGMSIIVSSHILAELEQYATEMLVLQKGRLISHRRIGDSDAATPMMLRLAQADHRLTAVLAALPGAQVDAASSDEAQFRLDTAILSPDQALKTLIEAGLPIVAYGAARKDLQAAYLDEVAKVRH